MDNESKKKLDIFLKQFDRALSPARIEEARNFKQYAEAIADMYLLGEMASEIIKRMKMSFYNPGAKIRLELWIKKAIKGQPAGWRINPDDS